VSKLVVPPHVWIVATPDALGVHWKTDSGAVFVPAHVPARPLAPAVAPVNTPPPAGTTTGTAHVAPGSVLVVVLLVDVVVLLLVLVLLVLLVDVVVLLVVVVGTTGVLTLNVKLPAWPPNPSTTT